MIYDRFVISNTIDFGHLINDVLFLAAATTQKQQIPSVIGGEYYDFSCRWQVQPKDSLMFKYVKHKTDAERQAVSFPLA